MTVLILTESSQDHFLLFHLAFSALIDDQKVSIVGLNTMFMGKTCKISLGEEKKKIMLHLKRMFSGYKNS